LRKTKTFLDSGVLISAHRGEPAIRKRALALPLLDDPERTFVTSDFVRLEILPKATYKSFTRRKARESPLFRVKNLRVISLA